MTGFWARHSFQKLETDVKVRCVAYNNPKTGAFIGVCDSLNIVVEENSLDDLQIAFSEALRLLLNDLHETGEMDAFLAEKGWSQHIPAPGHDAVPWEIVMQGRTKYGTSQTAA